MTINSFHNSQFHASVNHHTSIHGNQSNACAAMWYHVLFAMLLRQPKKGVADLCLYHLQLMNVQMLCIPVLKILCISNRSACTTAHAISMTINWTIGIRQFFTRKNFPNPDSSKFSTVKILCHTVIPCKIMVWLGIVMEYFTASGPLVLGENSFVEI